MARPRWEYRLELIDQAKIELVVSSLNGFGSDGWELVNVDLNHGHYWMIFKRPLGK